MPALTVTAHVMIAGTNVPLGLAIATTAHDDATAIRNGAAVCRRPLIEFASS